MSDLGKRFELHLGDCMDVLRTLGDASVDSIVTDPPYHLTTGKKGGTGPASVNLDSPYGRSKIGTGFMGMTWDGGDVAMRPATWAECMRVLKPGGHLLAFSGSRTYHRMTCAIEDAGFEIRDQIMWIYGSGFPKSKNVGDGRGTALKPAHEPICVARKPFSGTVAANVVVHGTGALNIDACRVGESGATKRSGQAEYPKNEDGTEDRSGSWARTGHEIVELNVGRWPANVIHDGSDEVLEQFPDAPGQLADASSSSSSSRGTQNVYGAMACGNARDGEATAAATYSTAGGTNFAMKPGARRLDSGSAARFFYCAKASRADRNEGLHSGDTPAVETEATMRERETADWQQRNGNHHPTVKPTNLMAYLCRLVTPPGGLVLDPFMGSGSTGKAAMREGFRFIGIDMTPEYVAIAQARIEAECARIELENAVLAEQQRIALAQFDLFSEQA